MAQRRMALRLAREDSLLENVEPQDELSSLPSVARVLATAAGPTDGGEPTDKEGQPLEAGDDDADDDLNNVAAGDFYADALEDA